MPKRRKPGRYEFFWQSLAMSPTAYEAWDYLYGLRREYILEALQENDPTGTYTDEASDALGWPPTSHPEAVQLALRVLQNQIWDAKDPRQGQIRGFT